MTLMLHLRHGNKQELFLMLAHDSTLFAKRDIHTGQKMLAYDKKADKVHILSSFVPFHQGSLFVVYIHISTDRRKQPDPCEDKIKCFLSQMGVTAPEKKLTVNFMLNQL